VRDPSAETLLPSTQLHVWASKSLHPLTLQYVERSRESDHYLTLLQNGIQDRPELRYVTLPATNRVLLVFIGYMFNIRCSIVQPKML